MAAPAEAAVTHTFDPPPGTGALQITTSAGESVVVDCNSGNTRVNTIELATPTVPCNQVQSLTVTGDAGIQTIDLSGVTTADFTTLTSVLANGGDEPTGPGDVITGTPLSDTINGGAGDETINAGAGEDTIAGDNGNDTITAGPGNDPDVRGGNANDTLIWNPGDGSDTFSPQGGDDIIQVSGDAANDQFTVAGDGDGDGFLIDRLAPTTDQIHVTSPTEVVSISTGDGSDTITGGADVAAGNPLVTATTTLQGGNDIDTVTGTEGRDTITGGDGNDILSGNGGDDTAVWSAGDDDDSFDGGAGTDIAQVTGDTSDETFTFASDGSGVDIDRTLPIAAHIEADTIERVNVSAGDGLDTVTGSAGLAALGVTSTLAGGNGADDLTGTDANDTLQGNADSDELTGGDGDDALVWNGGDGSDVFHGGQGSDVATVNGDLNAETYSLAPDGGDIDIDRSAPTPGQVDADTIERVSVAGGAGADTITAATGFDALGVDLTLSGGNDGDIITGSDAADTLNGNAGSDTVDGAGGDDVLNLDPLPVATDDYDGEGGDDSLVVTAESGNGIWGLQPDASPGKIKLFRQVASPTVTMLAGTIEHLSINLGSGTDSLTASGSLAPLGLQTTTMLGDSGNDTIVGSDVADTIGGGTNNDTVTGGAGSDILNGEAGIDSVMARDAEGDQVDCGTEADTAQTDQPSLDPVLNCETVDALAEPPVVTPTTPPATPSTTTPTDSPCDELRKKLKKAKSKAKRKKLKRKLRQNDC